MVKARDFSLFESDCIEAMRAMDDGSVSMALTDPPYGISYSSRWRTDGFFSHRIAGDDSLDAVRRAAPEIMRVLADDSALFMFCSPRRQDEMGAILEEAGFKVKNRIVWDKRQRTAGDCKGAFAFRYETLFLAAKGRPLLRGFRYDDIWEFPRVTSHRMAHQNQKPVPLLMRAIESFSDEDATVLDPFMGSGSTGVACALAGRRFVGMELDARYFPIARGRIEAAYSDETRAAVAADPDMAASFLGMPPLPSEITRESTGEIFASTGKSI